MIWSSVEFVSICVYIALGNLLFLFDFMVTKVTFVLLQSFFILFFYLIVSWPREASCGDYGESYLSESLNFDMGAGTGWNCHGCFLWAKCECIILRKERWTSVILVIKKAGCGKNCWLLPDVYSSHFIFSFIYLLLISLFLQWKFNFYIFQPSLKLVEVLYAGGSAVKILVAKAGDAGSTSGSGRSPGEGNVNPSQDSCLENSMDRGPLRVTVHKVAKSWTWLSDWAYTHTQRKELSYFWFVSSCWLECEHDGSELS